MDYHWHHRLLLVSAALIAVSEAFVSVAHRSCPRRRHDLSLLPSERRGLRMTGEGRDVVGDDGSTVVYVALTREEGKNAKLASALAGRKGVQAVELPCIAHADGDDYPRLKEALLSRAWDYVAVTSPEGAKVLASVLGDPGDKKQTIQVPPIAAVGKATEEVLNEYGLAVSFCPSKATAKTLVAELPGGAEPGSQQEQYVLYPASQRAQLTLENGLRERGFQVTRLNTYDTVTAEWCDEDRERARQCRVACFASPSSVKGWLHNSAQKSSVLAACIGETSAQACRERGWPEDRIFFPDKPGIEGWVEAVDRAVESLSAVPHS